MSIDFDFWMERGRKANAAWRSLRVGEHTRRGRVYDEEMILRARRTFGSGMHFTSRVHGFKTSDSGWSIRVSGHLGDNKVRALESSLPGRGCIVPNFCQFDVLSTYSWLNSIESRSLPRLAPDTSDDQIEDILRQNSQMVDGIWGTFGGYGIHGYEKLAIAVMRHSNRTLAHSPTVAKVCAALSYGDNDAARWLLQEYEDTTILFARHGIDSLTRSPSGEIRPDIAKLLQMLE